MESLLRYRAQSVLALVQALIIIIGCFTLRAAIVVRGLDPSAPIWKFHIWFILNWGFTLVLIPLIWAITTIWLENHPRFEFSQRWTIITGLALMIVIGLYAFGLSVTTGASLIQMVPQNQNAH